MWQLVNMKAALSIVEVVTAPTRHSEHPPLKPVEKSGARHPPRKCRAFRGGARQAMGKGDYSSFAKGLPKKNGLPVFSLIVLITVVAAASSTLSARISSNQKASLPSRTR